MTLNVDKIMKTVFEKSHPGEFPSNPVARTQCFHCHGQGSIPGQGTENQKLLSMAKKTVEALIIQTGGVRGKVREGAVIEM